MSQIRLDAKSYWLYHIGYLYKLLDSPEGANQHYKIFATKLRNRYIIPDAR